MKLKLCVIGCGGFARIFADSLAAVRGSVDLYFASRDYNRANPTQMSLEVWDISDPMKKLLQTQK